jgi:hypothetical protein
MATIGKALVVKAVVAAVLAAALAALAFWLLRPSPDGSGSADAGTSSSASAPEAGADDRLMRLLPAGYPPGTCRPTHPPDGAVAAVSCTQNADQGGPASATFTLSGNQAALTAAFVDVVASFERVDCPGGIQSPGPWRRRATTQAPSGMLVCGLHDGRAMVAWTTDADALFCVTRADATGPSLDRLYAWWAVHS